MLYGNNDLIVKWRNIDANLDSKTNKRLCGDMFSGKEPIARRLLVHWSVVISILTPSLLANWFMTYTPNFLEVNRVILFTRV